MRVAALSDVHGNLWALEAVLADAARRGVDRFVNAGDLLSGPLEPAATADRLIALGWPTVAGNQERQLLACARSPGGPSDQFAFRHTTPAHHAWLAGLPQTLELEGGVLVCHGTPEDDHTYLLEEPSSGRLRPLAAPELEARLRGGAHRLIVCGHSHLPRVARLSDGRLVVNPGSVGLQAYDSDEPCPHVSERGGPEARYALCELGPAGWTAELVEVPYDFRPAEAMARRNGREDWAYSLRHGCVAR